MSSDVYQAEINKLHRQIATLQDTVLDLRRKMLPPLRFPATWKLRRKEDRALGLLIDAAPAAVSRAQLKIAFSGRTSGDLNDANLNVVIGTLRKKLEALGCGRIKACHGAGYYLSVADAKQIQLKAARAAARPRGRAS